MEKFDKLKSQFNTNIPKAFKNVEPFDRAHVNAALSISKEGLPSRFLAGIIPVFSLAEALQLQFDVPTSVRIFAPINLAVACNGHDSGSLEEFRRTGDKVLFQGEKLINAFQKAQFPSVSWRLVHDQVWTPTADKLLASIWSRSLELDEDQLNQARSAVEQTGKSNVQLYMPHHLFGWQDCFDDAIFPREDKSKESDLIINCMSQSERHFQAFRRRLVWDFRVSDPGLLGARTPIDLMTERCPGPHYIRSRDGHQMESSLTDLMTDGFTSTARRLARLVALNPKFETARKDLLSIFDFFHQRWVMDPNQPTLDEFIGGLK